MAEGEKRKWGSERYDRDTSTGKYRKSLDCEACGKPAGPNYWSTHYGNQWEGLILCNRKRCPALRLFPDEAAIRALCLSRAGRPNPRGRDVSGLAGCVEERRSRDTGSLIRIYHAKEAGLDECKTDYEPKGLPWATVCETHGHIVNHRTLRLARYHAAVPSGWCEGCMR